MITIELPYPPSANRYWRKFRNQIVKSQEARDYQEQVGWLAKAAGLREPFDCDVAMSLRIYRPQRRGDLSNRVKIVEDALQGIAYEDDDQVVEMHLYRYDDKRNPRVEIEIAEAI